MYSTRGMLAGPKNSENSTLQEPHRQGTCTKRVNSHWDAKHTDYTTLQVPHHRVVCTNIPNSHERSNNSDTNILEESHRRGCAQIN